jgi:hypothetical protein
MAKRVSINNYYNYILIPTVILIVCLGVTIPFLVYEEQRLTSKQLMNSIRNVLSPSNGTSIVRASSVADLDLSLIPLFIALIGIVGAVVVIFLQIKLPLGFNFSLVSPILVAFILTGSLALYATNYSKLDKNMKIMGIMGIILLILVFSSSLYEILNKKEKKDISGNILP